MKQHGVLHTGFDGSTRVLKSEDLPPVLDLETLVWKLDADTAREKAEAAAPVISPTPFPVLPPAPTTSTGKARPPGNNPFPQLPAPLVGPQTPTLGKSAAAVVARTTSPSSIAAATQGEAKSAPYSTPRAPEYSSFQVSNLKKGEGFGDHLANFTAESARFWKWLCLEPAERSPEKGRLHFHGMLKYVNLISSQSSTPTLGIDKQVQKLTISFQSIDAKNGEEIPRFLMQQVTETLISLAGIIKGTIALNILNKRNVVRSFSPLCFMIILFSYSYFFEAVFGRVKERSATGVPRNQRREQAHQGLSNHGRRSRWCGEVNSHPEILQEGHE